MSWRCKKCMGPLVAITNKVTPCDNHIKEDGTIGKTLKIHAEPSFEFCGYYCKGCNTEHTTDVNLVDIGFWED